MQFQGKKAGFCRKIEKMSQISNKYSNFTIFSELISSKKMTEFNTFPISKHFRLKMRKNLVIFSKKKLTFCMKMNIL